MVLRGEEGQRERMGFEGINGSCKRGLDTRIISETVSSFGVPPQLQDPGRLFAGNLVRQLLTLTVLAGRGYRAYLTTCNSNGRVPQYIQPTTREVYSKEDIRQW